MKHIALAASLLVAPATAGATCLPLDRLENAMAADGYRIQISGAPRTSATTLFPVVETWTDGDGRYIVFSVEGRSACIITMVNTGA